MTDFGITVRGWPAKVLLWTFRLHRRYDEIDATRPMLRFGIAMAILSPAFLIADGHFAVQHLWLTVSCAVYLLVQATLRLAYLGWRP